MDSNLRMNDILTVGTHNSYKQAISGPIMAMLSAVQPKTAMGLDYSHPGLAAELDDGARALEIDIANDPQGGRYAHPMGLTLTAQAPSKDFVAALSKPGMKVLHVQDLDFRANCLTFVSCLTIIRTWSRAHPHHVPILITMNTNDEKAHMPGGVDEMPFDTKAYDALDKEVLSVFSRGDLITPDLVRGKYATLREAVMKQGWPMLGAARGKIMFALDEGEVHNNSYRGGRKTLEGRVFFLNTSEAAADAAYITLNEKSDAARIAAAVKAGFIVRTRADADTVEARANDASRRDWAFGSGAQYVSTDYRRPDKRFSPYEARLPNNAIALCNPLRAPARCAGIAIEP